MWGGSGSQESPAYKVSNLQSNLKSVGVYTSAVDGDFGSKTFKALKIFQWACANIKACNKKGSRLERSLKPSILTTGKLNKVTYDELKIWVDNQQITTGDLVRATFTNFSNIEASSGFKKIGSTFVNKDDIVISQAALQLLIDINNQAKAKKIIIKVNQAFRVHGVKVTGAVVVPATKSQHLIGHALDCNIVDGGNWNNSTAFKNNKASDGAKSIIKAIKKLGHRWGGDFSKVDTPHFDKKLDATGFSYEAKFYLNQRMISESQNITKAIITE